MCSVLSILVLKKNALAPSIQHIILDVEKKALKKKHKTQNTEACCYGQTLIALATSGTTTSAPAPAAMSRNSWRVLPAVTISFNGPEKSASPLAMVTSFEAFRVDAKSSALALQGPLVVQGRGGRTNEREEVCSLTVLAPF